MMEKKIEWGGKPLIVQLAFGSIPYTIDFPCKNAADIPEEGTIIVGMDFIPETDRYLVVVGHVNSVLGGTGEKFDIEEADFIHLMNEMKNKKEQGWTADILDDKARRTYNQLSGYLFTDCEWLVYQHYVNYKKEETVHRLVLDMLTGD